MDAGWIWFIPWLHDLTMKIWKEWEAHGSWEVMPERNRSSGLLRATPPFRASTVGLHNLQQLYIRGAAKLRRLRNILSAFISPPWASRALPAGSEDVRDNTSSSSSLLSSAADECEILIPPADSSASSICDPHDLSFLAASAAAGPEPRGADDCFNSLEKRQGKARQGKFIYLAHFIHSGNSKCFQKGHTRAELSQREKFTMRALHALRPNT